MSTPEKKEKIELESEKLDHPDKQSFLYKEYQDYLEIVEKKQAKDKNVEAKKSDPNQDVLEDGSAAPTENLEEPQAKPAEPNPESVPPTKDVLEPTPPKDEFPPPEKS